MPSVLTCRIHIVNPYDEELCNNAEVTSRARSEAQQSLNFQIGMLCFQKLVQSFRAV